MRGKKKINYKGWGRPAEGRRERICVASGAVRVFLLEEKEVVAGRFRRERRTDRGGRAIPGESVWLVFMRGKRRKLITKGLSSFCMGPGRVGRW